MEKNYDARTVYPAKLSFICIEKKRKKEKDIFRHISTLLSLYIGM